VHQMSGRLTVTHQRRPFGALIANYRVLIDGHRCGRLRRGKTRTFELQPGAHILKLTILHHDSGDFAIRIAPGAEVNLTCRARPYGGRFAAVGHRDDWIIIEHAGQSIA